jgi:hypothetical protein
VADNVGITYDALGRVVEEYKGGSYTEFGYSTAGQKIQAMNGQSVLTTFVPMVGGDVGLAPSGSTFSYTRTDWLGNARLLTTMSQTVAGDVAYAPFGETYASSGTPWLSFTGGWRTF